MFAARPRNIAIWQRMQVKETNASRGERTVKLPSFKSLPGCTSVLTVMRKCRNILVSMATLREEGANLD